MANNYSTLNALFTNIANAIRKKTNSNKTIIADNFPAEIDALRTGFDYINSEVTEIPDYAFYKCKDLNSVELENVTSIGVSAFDGCTNMKEIFINSGVENMGENAFSKCDCIIYCKAESIPETWHENWNPDNCIVIYGNPVETFDISATENDNVIAKLYSNGNKYILIITGNGNMKGFNYNTFPWYSYKDNIDCVYISNGVTGIPNYAFYGCTGLTSITIPDSVTSIGDYAFYNCKSLTSIIIPDSVTSIGYYTFYGCTSLTSINIPDSVTRIPNYAFDGCTGLTSITIPDSVTSIGTYTFSDCTGLTSITYTGTISQWNSMTFGTNWNYNTSNYTIHCTDGDIAKDGTITYH